MRRTDEDLRDPETLESLADRTVLICQPADRNLAATERVTDGALHPIRARTEIRQARMAEGKQAIDVTAIPDQRADLLLRGEPEIMPRIGLTERSDRRPGQEDVPQ